MPYIIGKKKVEWVPSNEQSNNELKWMRSMLHSMLSSRCHWKPHFLSFYEIEPLKSHSPCIFSCQSFLYRLHIINADNLVIKAMDHQCHTSYIVSRKSKHQQLNFRQTNKREKGMTKAWLLWYLVLSWKRICLLLKTYVLVAVWWRDFERN